jgi:hypothetical protein
MREKERAAVAGARACTRGRGGRDAGEKEEPASARGDVGEGAGGGCGCASRGAMDVTEAGWVGH